MDKKTPQLISKATGLARKLVKAFLFLCLFLVLLYAAFKFWEYKSIADKKAELASVRSEQKHQYEALSSDVAMYAPLFIGTSSLDFVKRGKIEFIFKYLLGEDLPVFLEAMEQSSPLVFSGNLIFGSGCKKQTCGDLRAAYLLDTDRNEFIAAILENGKPIYYGLADGKPAPAAFEKWASIQAIEAAQ